MILISGATKGIGRAIAERFASAGNDVFVIARTRKDLENLQTSWKEQFPGTHLYFFAGDLSTPAVFPKIEEDIGRINRPIRAIVNNVGLYQPGGLLAEEDTFSSLLQTNLLSAHRLTRTAFPFFDQDSGHLFTIGSVATTDFASHMTAYAASKYALEGWHLALEKELAHTTVRTTLVVPGATLTAAWEGVEKLPDRILAPEQVAAAVWEAFTAPQNQAMRRVELRLRR